MEGILQVIRGGCPPASFRLALSGKGASIPIPAAQTGRTHSYGWQCRGVKNFGIVVCCVYAYLLCSYERICNIQRFQGSRIMLWSLVGVLRFLLVRDAPIPAREDAESIHGAP